MLDGDEAAAGFAKRKSAVVWWLVFPPVTRKTRVQFLAAEFFGPGSANLGYELDCAVLRNYKQQPLLFFHLASTL